MILPIIDAHMHLWDLTHHRYPWLQEARREMWIGDHSSLRRDYLIQDYLQDAQRQNVVKCVHLQAQWDHSDPVGETAWLQSVADEHKFPHGIVGFCELGAEDAQEVIEGHLRYRGIRGIRQDINWHPDPVYCFCARTDYMRDRTWRRNISLLKRYELSFDLQIYAGHQGEDAYHLIKDFEGIQFILDHSGAPADRSAEAMARWRASIRRLAELPNIVTKLSGFDMFDQRWTTASLREPIMQVIETFGPARCLFASNFPVSGLYGTYDRLVNTFRDILSALSRDEQRMILHDNAARVYRV